MRLSEFIDLFTVALYHYSELHGAEYHPAGEIVKSYGLPFKESWAGIIFDDNDFSYRVRSARNIGSFSDQAVMMSAGGIRWIEDHIGEDNVSAFLEQNGARNPDKADLPVNEIDAMINNLAPAADRVVTLRDNQPEREAISKELAKIRNAVTSSNTLDPDEKSDVTANLAAAESLIGNSDTWFAGSMQYLVFERVKKAFERTIEDAIRVIIIGSLSVLAAIILGLL